VSERERENEMCSWGCAEVPDVVDQVVCPFLCSTVYGPAVLAERSRGQKPGPALSISCASFFQLPLSLSVCVCVAERDDRTVGLGQAAEASEIGGQDKTILERRRERE
jgi:hypothetical protein